MLDALAIARFAFHDQQKCSWTASALQEPQRAVPMLTIIPFRSRAPICDDDDGKSPGLSNVCARSQVRWISARAHGAIITVDCTACRDAPAGGKGGDKKRSSPLRSREARSFLTTIFKMMCGRHKLTLADASLGRWLVTIG
jgi:hypothetical protein